MTNRRIPTRIVETGRVMRGPSGQGVGWLQPLAERARNLRAQIQGINARLNTNLAHGVPSCVTGEYTFLADTTTQITIPAFPVNPDLLPVGPALVVNPIILSGQTYRIPITFTPPGVLQAHNLVVGIEAGFTSFVNQSRQGITPLNDYRQSRTATKLGFLATTPNLGVIRYTWQQQVLGDFSSVMPFLPFLWNIIDEKSGRPYSQEWLPHGALLNTRGTRGANPDGELFEFDTPWLFERDGQVAFLFRPIMDLYQVDAGDATLPWGVDDLSGGRRVQQATVRVEFHGTRNYTSQDVLKEGARV